MLMTCKCLQMSAHPPEKVRKKKKVLSPMPSEITGLVFLSINSRGEKFGKVWMFITKLEVFFWFLFFQISGKQAVL